MADSTYSYDYLFKAGIPFTAETAMKVEASMTIECKFGSANKFRKS